MCDIYGKTRKQIGYKVLAYKRNRFYSIFTGQEIKIGDVPKAPKNCNTLTTGWNMQLQYDLLKNCKFYKPAYNGNTGAFINLNDAINLTETKEIYEDKYKLVIVKIKFIGTILHGSYNGHAIIAGSKIKSINIVITI